MRGDDLKKTQNCRQRHNGEHRFKLDSNGMSILEVMLGIVLFSIVALGVTFFISTSTKTCNHAEDTIRIQQEAQVVLNQLVTITMEANSVASSVTSEHGDVTYFVYHTNKVTKETTKEHIFFFQKSSHNLYYYEITNTTSDVEKQAIQLELSGGVSNIVCGQLMGKYLTDLTADVSSQQVSFQIKYQLNGKVIESKDTVVMRNKKVKVVTPLI